MPRNRAERRINERRAKRRSLRIMTMNSFSTWEPSEREVGRWASTHGRPCSCMGCKRGPRPDRGPSVLVEDLADPEELDVLADHSDPDYEAEYDDYDPEEEYYRESGDYYFANGEWRYAGDDDDHLYSSAHYRYDTEDFY